MEIRDTLANNLLKRDYGALNPQQKSVIDLIADEAPSGIEPELVDDRTYWERLADRVAHIGGSWRFIAGFAVALAGWTGFNLLAPKGAAFDPYPFIFLNLLLSMLAAIQAPVIMMSQNRQATVDRRAAEHDYVVNLRAELEIMLLHDKLDEMRERDLRERLDKLTSAVEALTAASAAPEA